MSIAQNLYKKSQLSLAFEILINYKQYYYKTNNNKIFKNPKNIFHYGTYGNYTRFLEILIENNNNNFIYMLDSQGRSILYLCARSGFSTLCRMLLEKGVDINQKSGIA